MNSDYAIILNFNITNEQNLDTDDLVKVARNIGVRAVSGPEILKDACQKYTINLSEPKNGEDLTADNVIDEMMQNRKNGKQTIINITVDEDGNINSASQELLDKINNWMHMFGHAFNEGHPSNLEVDQDGFVLENHHADYQKYVFLKSPLPKEIVISGLEQEPNRVEWVENRIDLDYSFKNHALKIKLEEPADNFKWQVLRIQAHRPEDDIKETKF